MISKQIKYKVPEDYFDAERETGHVVSVNALLRIMLISS
jgi:hypothetical protein